MISKRGLRKLIGRHPEAGPAALAWYRIAERADWRSWTDVRASLRSADQVGQVLIFNLLGNRYRLITRLHYPARTLYVKALMTHAEYGRKEWLKWS